MPIIVALFVSLLFLFLIPASGLAFIEFNNTHGLFDIFFVSWGVASFVGIILVFGYNRSLKARVNFLTKMNKALDKAIEENTRKVMDTNERLKSVLDAVPSPVYHKDCQGIYLGCNEAFAEMILGLKESDIVGKSLFDLPENIPPEFARRYHEKDMELIEHPGTQFYESEVKCADGELREYFFSKATIKNPMGRVDGLVGVMVDITKRKHAETALLDSQQRTRSFQEASFGAVLIHDEGRIIDCNKNLLDLTGYTREELIHQDGLEIVPASFRPQVLSRIKSGDTKPYDAEVMRKDGEIIPIEIKARIMPFQGRLVRVAEIRDITERKKAEQEMEELIVRLDEANEKLLQLSTTDSLTSLYCRNKCVELLDDEIIKANKKNKSVAVVMADIDNFRHINNTYGKAFGDRVLQRVSQVILKCIREIDFVGRFGGDEFLMVLPGTGTKMGALVADRIRISIEEISWNTPGLFITMSMGISSYSPKEKNDPLKEADALLSKARKKGGNQLLTTANTPPPKKRATPPPEKPSPDKNPNPG